MAALSEDVRLDVVERALVVIIELLPQTLVCEDVKLGVLHLLPVPHCWFAALHLNYLD